MSDVLGSLPITPDQCRHGRELLGWDMLDLAEAARVRLVPIIRLEDGKRLTSDSRTAKIRLALEAAGVEFLEDGGTRLRERPAVAPQMPPAMVPLAAERTEALERAAAVFYQHVDPIAAPGTSGP